MVIKHLHPLGAHPRSIRLFQEVSLVDREQFQIWATVWISKKTSARSEIQRVDRKTSLNLKTTTQQPLKSWNLLKSISSISKDFSKFKTKNPTNHNRVEVWVYSKILKDPLKVVFGWKNHLDWARLPTAKHGFRAFSWGQQQQRSVALDIAASNWWWKVRFISPFEMGRFYNLLVYRDYIIYIPFTKYHGHPEISGNSWPLTSGRFAPLCSPWVQINFVAKWYFLLGQILLFSGGELVVGFRECTAFFSDETWNSGFAGSVGNCSACE